MEPPCGSTSCLETSATARLTSGEIVLTVEGEAPQTFRVGAECTSAFTLSPSSIGHGTASTVPFITCRSGDREISITAGFLGNLPSEEQGTRAYRRELSPAQTNTQVRISPDCAFPLVEDKLVIDVTDAQGQGTSTDPFVTSDYLRRVTIHLETVQAVTSCGRVALVGDVAIEQAASDYVTREHVCYCI
jgi:hypothetical protein